MSQVQEQPTNQQQPTPAAPPQASAPTPAHEEADIFADGFSEADISAMFDADNEADGTNEGDSPESADAQEGAQQPDQAQEAKDPEAQPGEQPKADEQPQQPEAYELPLFGQNVKLTGDQLIQAAEAGIQLMQQRPQVEKAMQLMQAVQSDQRLREILTAYSQGRHLPQTFPDQQPQPQQPQPGSQEEAMAILQQRVLQQAEQALLPRLLQAVEAKYKPFVDDVNNFAQQTRTEKAFAKYQADPEYSAVNALMTQNLQAKVAEGAITMQQAAEIDARLKADPQLYGHWFGKFKAAAQNAKKQAATVQNQPVQTIPHAPKLEGSAATAPSTAEKLRMGMVKALDGDPEGFNILFDNQ